MPLPLRFWAKVDKLGPVPENRPGLGPCWNWTGAVQPRRPSSGGYGAYFLYKRGRQSVMRAAHLVAYVDAKGPVPAGLELDHLCRNRACCNPSHLEAVTHLVNMQRGALGMRTHCPMGHPFADTIQRPRQTRGRRCNACAKERQRRKREARGAGPHNGNKTHCAAGHLYDEANTCYLRRGGRACRACRRDGMRKLRQ